MHEEIKTPPRPAFSTPSADVRARMLGTFRYEILSGGAIKILDGWARTNIVRVYIPQLEGIENAPKDCYVAFHRAGVKHLQSLFAAWEAAGLLRYLKSWAGTFNPRMIRGSHTDISNHAYGSAFDINAAWNPLGHEPATGSGTVIPLVKLANEHGFFWGGHYNSRKDGMHFELAILNMFPKTLPNLKAEEIKFSIPEKSSAAGNVSHNSAAISSPMSDENDENEPTGGGVSDGATSTQTTIKTDTVDVTSSATNGTQSPGKNFDAVIPQIDTTKGYLKKLFGGSVLATAGAFLLGLPEWLQIALAILVLVVVVGGIVILAKYHEKIFAYVTAMNTLRATQGVDNPILTTERE